MTRAAVAPVAALALGVWSVRARGFVGISHDDAARCLLAWDFARAPSLDPTRSSWLPAHTWLLGAALRLWPDAVDCARALSLTAGVVAVLASLAGARRLGATSFGAGAALALLCAWRWTALPAAASAVPELPCAALVSTGLALLAGDGARSPSRAALAGLALTAACGMRYEAWFAAAAVVGVELARRPRDRAAWTLALTAALMPAAWLAINHARAGDALDFVRRVEAYRATQGALPPALHRLARYPTLAAVECGALALLAWEGARATAFGDDARRRLAAAGAVLAMLTWGDLRGGGPTHHPARALVVFAWALAPLAARGASVSSWRRAVLVAGLALWATVTAPTRDDWRGGVDEGAVCAGEAVRAARSRAEVGAPWFVEAAREDFLWVEALSGAPERATADRPWGAARATRALTPDARVAALSGDSRDAVAASAGMRAVARCGAWTVYARGE